MSLYTNKKEILSESKRDASRPSVLHLADLANDTNVSNNYSDSSVEDIVQRALRGEYGSKQKELESALLFQERGGARKHRPALYNDARNVFVDTKAPAASASFRREGSANLPAEARRRHVAISRSASDLDSEDAYKDQQYVERITKQLRAMQLVDPAEANKDTKKKKGSADKAQKGRKIDEAVLKRLITPNTAARAKVQEKYERRLEREKAELEKERRRKKSVSPVATQAGKRLYEQARALTNDLKRRQEEEEENRKKNEEEFTFRPTISTFAQKLIDDDDYIPIEERNGEAAYHKERRERLRLEKEADVMREHTFRPKLSAGSKQILREQGYVSRSSNGDRIPDDPAQATERLYAEGGERLLRQQIRQRIEARKAAQGRVGQQRRISKGDVQQMTERMSLWQQQRESHCDALRQEMDKKIQEQLVPEPVARKVCRGESKVGEWRRPTSRTPRPAPVDVHVLPLRRTRSLPLTPTTTAAKEKPTTTNKRPDIPIKEVAVNQNAVPSGQKAVPFVQDDKRLHRAASTGGLSTAGPHQYNMTAGALTARSLGTSGTPSDHWSPQPRTPYMYGERDQEGKSGAPKHAHTRPNSLPLEDLPFEDQVESIVDRELRSIRYGAFFYKYARGDTVTLKEVKEQARRYYPEDSQMVAALVTQLGGSGNASITKSQFVEALLAYEESHEPFIPLPEKNAQAREDEIDAALLRAPEVAAKSTAVAPSQNPRTTIYYVTEEMAAERKADVSKVLLEKRSGSRCSSRGPASAREAEGTDSAKGKRERKKSSEKGAAGPNRTKATSAPPEALSHKQPRDPKKMVSASTTPNVRRHDTQTQYPFKPSLSARTIALSEIDRQKRESYAKERQLKTSELEILKSAALKEGKKDAAGARGRVHSPKGAPQKSAAHTSSPRRKQVVTSATGAPAGASKEGTSPFNVELSSLSSSSDSRGLPSSSTHKIVHRSPPSQLSQPAAVGGKTNLAAEKRPAADPSGISSLEEINSELAEMDQLFDALYKKAERRKAKTLDGR